MPDPRYATPEYRAAYKAARQAQARGQWLECHQPACLMDDRTIAPDQPVDIAHDDSGTVILGPAHRYCNRADGGRRRHLLAATTSSVRRRVL